MASGLATSSRIASGSVGAYLLETLIVLFVVVALATVVLWMVRRAGFGRTQGPCQLLGRLPLEPRRCVYLVRIHQRVLVLGVSEAGITKLWQYRDDTQTVDLPPPAYLSFVDVLNRLRDGTKQRKRSNFGDIASPSEHETDGCHQSITPPFVHRQ